MPTPRDLAVTEYVRWRIQPIIDSKEMTQKAIALRVGVSPAYLSSFKNTGVGGKSITGFALFLGFKNAKALRIAAYDWYRSQGPKAAARAAESAVAAAIADVRALHPRLSDAQVQTILHRFADDAFAGREQDYWYRTIMEEVRRDYLREQALVSEIKDRALVGPEEKAIKAHQDVFRKGHTLRKAAAAEKAAAEKAETDGQKDPPVSVPAESKKPRRKRA